MKKTAVGINVNEAFARAAGYCSRYERCISQVSLKLKKWTIRSDIAGIVIERLINENYINEERFAKAFTGMQFRMNKWGRLKIVHSLKQLNIPERLIHNSIEEIDEAEYRQVLTSLIMKKKSQIKSEEILTTQKKVATFAIGKGYEPELVWDVVKRMIQPYGNT